MERDHAIGRGVEAVVLDLRLRIDEIRDDEPTSERRRVVEDCFLLSDQIREGVFGAAEVDRHDLAALGVLQRNEDEPGADVSDNGPKIVDTRNERARWPPRTLQVDDGRRAASGTRRRIHGCITSVLGHAGHVHQIRLIGGRMDKPVLALRRTHRTEDCASSASFIVSK